MAILKDRVKDLEDKIEKLEKAKTLKKNLTKQAEEKIEKIVKKEEDRLSGFLSEFPEIFDEICQVLEDELGIILIPLRKRIKNL